MKKYLKNILRNILKNKASYLGAIFVISLGILIYVAMADVLINLKSKVNNYYDDYHFADIFATVKEMPESKLENIKKIEGIDEVFGRLTMDTRLLLEDQTNIVTLHLLAYDDDDLLNRFKLSPNLEAIEADTIYLGSKMYDYYQFEPNTSLELIIGHTTKRFTLVGTLQSPEYLYSVPPSGVQMPDSEIYDIACMRKEDLENLSGKKHMVTELGFTLKNGYSYEDVKYDLEQNLASYGLITLAKKDDQLSNSMISTEFDQLSAMATILPILFLIISMFMLYIILKKMVAGDRSLIGTLKAFGFTDAEILKVYLIQSVIIGLLGSLLGSFLSTFLGKYMFALYGQMYNLPYTHYDCYLSNQLVGLIMALLTSLVATYLGVKDVLHIQPAEAMRNAAPSTGKLHKLPTFLNKHLNSRQKMGIRAIYRHKFRSLVIALATTFPFAFISVLNTFGAACENVFFDQFTKIQTYDLKISLSDYKPYTDVLNTGLNIKGAYNVDASSEYAIMVTYQNRSEHTSLTALSPDSKVWHIMDHLGHFHLPSSNGLTINSALAKKLGITVGDLIEVQSSYLSVEPIKLPVTEIVTESFSGGCYISIDSLHHYFNITPMANAILLNCHKEDLEPIKASLTKTLNVSSVTDTSRALKSYKDMMNSMIQMINVFAYFSIFTGIILIYNISNISIRERQNEFGTLTILGTSSKEITEIIGFEQMVDFIVGILIGFPASIALKEIVKIAIFSDNYTISLKITPLDYLYSFCICLVILFISLMIVVNHIQKMNPTDVLKERE